MDDKLSLKPSFDAQVTAELMVATNALIPVKLASKLCSISRQEIDRRIQNGTFPRPQKLSNDEKSVRKAFYLADIQEWLKSPADYKQEPEKLEHNLGH